MSTQGLYRKGGDNQFAICSHRYRELDSYPLTYALPLGCAVDTPLIAQSQVLSVKKTSDALPFQSATCGCTCPHIGKEEKGRPSPFSISQQLILKASSLPFGKHPRCEQSRPK